LSHGAMIWFNLMFWGNAIALSAGGAVFAGDKLYNLPAE